MIFDWILNYVILSDWFIGYENNSIVKGIYQNLDGLYYEY